MPYELQMSNDGILRANAVGEIDRNVIDSFMKELEPFLSAATEDAPIALILDAHDSDRMTSHARRKLTTLNTDLRLGKFAILSSSRRIKVFAGFVEKTTNRSNIKLFNSEQSAIKWIKTKED